MLPLSLLKTAINHPMLVELKNGETYNGHLASCDAWMNIYLTQVICTSRDGDHFWKISECYIRGSTIKYLRIPDEVIENYKEDSSNRQGTGSMGRRDNNSSGGGRSGRGGSVGNQRGGGRNNSNNRGGFNQGGGGGGNNNNRRNNNQNNNNNNNSSSSNNSANGGNLASSAGNSGSSNNLGARPAKQQRR